MTEAAKRRHGCLAAFLVVAILLHALTTLAYVTAADAIHESMPHVPDWGLPALALLSVLNVVGLMAVWLWRKWGFFLAAGSALATAGVNMAVGVLIAESYVGMFGAMALYLVLHIGSERTRGWPQLE